MRELLGRHNQVQRKNPNDPIAEATLKRERDVRRRTTRAEGSEMLPPAASWLLAGYSFARLPVFAKATTSGGLRVGSPSDPLEREADLVADRVMQPESAGGAGLSMRPDGESDTVRRTSYDPYSMEEGEERLQPKAEAGRTVFAGPAASARVDAVAGRPGEALPAGRSPPSYRTLPKGSGPARSDDRSPM